MIKIREARINEAEELSRLALRSKAYWGYSNEFMEACRQELLIKEEMISGANNLYVVAEEKGVIVGFYSLEDVSNACVELGFLFVEPKKIRSGIGRVLIENAKDRVIQFGGKFLHFQGDPNAEAFYRAMGAELTGKRESASIPGRYLPTFSIKL